MKVRKMGKVGKQSIYPPHLGVKVMRTLFPVLSPHHNTDSATPKLKNWID